MQHAGTLKKRRRRNLGKVNGLSIISYDETLDTFTGHDLFGGDDDHHGSPRSSRIISSRTKDETKIKLSSGAMRKHRLEALSSNGRNRERVTRNPTFHECGENSEDDSERPPTPIPDPSPKHANIGNRSHFLDEDSMQRLRQLILLGIATGSFPWKWNENDYQIDKWSPRMEKLWWIQWVLVTIQTSFLTCFQLYAFLAAFEEGQRNYREIFMSSFSFLWYSYAMMCNLNLFFYKEKTRLYINTLLRFNYENVQKYLIHLDNYEDGGRLVINVAIITNITQVFVSVSLFLVMPFQRWYLFSYIYPKPWYWLLPGAFQEFIVVGQVITSYMLLSWVIVAHTNSLCFWLTEIHNHNDTDYTIDELRRPRKAFEFYRGLQILSICFNECMAPLAIPVVKIIMSTAMVPCGYVLIRSMNNLFIEEFPGILTYPLGVVDCATAAFAIMSMSAEVFDLGCSFIDSWSETKQKDFRRLLMSCPTLKIWTRRFYVITLSTTITFFKVVFDIITDFIITFP